jgi:H+-translocating NAD(P) transhydrogenase subunit alpha
VKIGTPREISNGEKRVALTPQSAVALKRLGYDCVVESGAGVAARFSDDAYREAGVTVVGTAADLWVQADIVAKLRPPEPAEVAMARSGQILISFLYPAQNADLLERLKANGVTAIAMDMVPRISRAQKMDALSSMANIAGYRAVIEAGNNFGRSPARSPPPARCRPPRCW